MERHDDTVVLQEFFEAHYHQDFDLDFEGEEAFLDWFVRENPPAVVNATVLALERQASVAEDRLSALVSGWTGMAWDAVRGGLHTSYREWLRYLAHGMRSRRPA